MNIVGKHVKLRALEISDLTLLHEWANEPELWEKLGGWHFPYSSLSTENWLRSRDNNNLVGHVFGIETEEDGLIGTVNLINIDWKNKNAFTGLMIGKKELRGKPYALDTVMTIMRYAFDELGLNRLDGDMIETNNLSINFFIKRCGWIKEGIKKDWFYRKGRYHDKIIVGITKERYYQFVENINYWAE